MSKTFTKKEFEQLLTDGWIQGEGYVFVSYASADWEKVYPTVLALRAMGINVYIDVEFREVQSSNWIDNFQKRMMKDVDCLGIVTFLSINYMRSYACLMEQLANRTQRMYSLAGEFHPCFYVALDPQMGSVQGIQKCIYDKKIRKESSQMIIQITATEEDVLKNFIANMHEDYGSFSLEDAETRVKELKDKHETAVAMYELIFQNYTPSIMTVDDPVNCAELLYRNFVGGKNETISMEIIEALKVKTEQRLRAAGYSFGETTEPTANAAVVDTPPSTPAPAVEVSVSAVKSEPEIPQTDKGAAAEVTAEKRGHGQRRKTTQAAPAAVQAEVQASVPRQSSIDLSAILSNSSEMKIGKYVRSVMRALADQNFCFSPEELAGFQTAAYTKKVFNLGSYEFLKPVHDPAQISALSKDQSGAARYWTEIFRFNGQDFLICSQWYDKQRPAFQAWLDAALENYAPVENAAVENAAQPEAGGKGNSEIVNYTLFGKAYSSIQKELMGNAFREVIARHPDKLELLAEQLPRCVATVDYSMQAKELRPVYFKSLLVYDLNGRTYSIGVHHSMKDKLILIAKLLDICGVDRSVLEIEGYELPVINRRKK